MPTVIDHKEWAQHLQDLANNPCGDALHLDDQDNINMWRQLFGTEAEASAKLTSTSAAQQKAIANITYKFFKVFYPA